MHDGTKIYYFPFLGPNVRQRKRSKESIGSQKKEELIKTVVTRNSNIHNSNRNTIHFTSSSCCRPSLPQPPSPPTTLPLLPMPPPPSLLVPLMLNTIITLNKDVGFTLFEKYSNCAHSNVIGTVLTLARCRYCCCCVSCGSYIYYCSCYSV